MNPSGVRFGTPAITTRGMKEDEIKKVAGWINEAVGARDDENKLAKIKNEVKEFCLKFPVPGVTTRNT